MQFTPIIILMRCPEEVDFEYGKCPISPKMRQLHSRWDEWSNRISNCKSVTMFLAGISVIIIQRVGRWSSEAFLEYIRDQVESFTLNVSRDMLRFENFINLNTEEQSRPSSDIEELESTQNENGPEVVPFSIRFNELSLSNEN